jgi:hypothetical protein
MSSHVADKQYPYTIQARRHVRNGRLPTAIHARWVAEALNHCLAFRRKEVASICVPHVGSVPAGQSGTVTYWHGAFAAGVGAKKLAARVILAKADTATLVSPYVDLQVGPVNGTLVTTDRVYSPKASSPADTLDEWTYGYIEYDLPAANTLYEWRLRASNYARPIALCLFEVCGSPVWEADGAVNPEINVGGPIFDSFHSAALNLAINLRNSNARHLWNWTRPTNSAVTIASGALTSVNLLDGSSTSVSSSSPGVTINNQRHRTVEVSTTPCLFMVRASQATGSGSVKLSDGTVTFSIDVDSTLEWKSKAIQLPTWSSRKWDILVSTGGANMTVDAVSLFEYGGAVLPASQTGFGTMAFGTDPFGDGP